MIVVDSSAVLAVVFGEHDFAIYGRALTTNAVAISAATLTETLVAAERRLGPDAADDVRRILTEVSARVLPYDEDHAIVAQAAWRRYGKGRHPARLNFGDCMAYATARLAGSPLLFKGDDFAQTDIASAL